MRGHIAVHSTHEAAERLGNIGHLLRGLLAEPAWRREFERSLLVGVYPFPAEGSVIDDLELRDAGGWAVMFDSESAEPLAVRGRATDARLARALSDVAEHYGVRLVFGERKLADGQTTPTLLASPQGLRRDRLDAFRATVQQQQGVDLAHYDGYPASTDWQDRRLARVLDPAGAAAGRYPDVPERVIVDSSGRAFPGGAGWADGRAVLPRVSSLHSFAGFATSNKYLLELQYHTFGAPALWAATRAVLAHWAPLAGGGYDPASVSLFAHDWLGVPLFWAMQAAGDAVRRTVYVAHESRVFRLLAESALPLRHAVLRAVCHPDGYDTSLYPHLRLALANGWDLATMFPGCDGFNDVFYHRLNREARKFDHVVAVGPWVRDEVTVSLRPESDREVTLCPVGCATRRIDLQEVLDRRERLVALSERYSGFRPDVVVTALVRPEVHKAPWRVLGLVNRLAERLAARARLKLACFWLAAPRPRPTRAQIERWARSFGWPLDHAPAPDGDLRADEPLLWRGVTDFNERYLGRAQVFYINQFGWTAGDLGALQPGETVFEDFRLGTDVELDLAAYEPFGYAALEPYGAGAVCVFSDVCGASRHLDEIGLGASIVTGRFTAHGRPPREMDAVARRRVEGVVYDQIIDELFKRLGIHPPEDAVALRRERLLAAQAALRDLSWEASVRKWLLPALGLGPRPER